MSYEVIFYEKSNGRCPVEEFLLELKRKNTRLGTCVVRDIEMLEQFGHELKFPDVRYMHDGVYELRSSAGSNIARVFYFFFSGNKIILTNGFIKKTQKTPPGELKKADQYKKDFEARYENL